MNGVGGWVFGAAMLLAVPIASVPAQAFCIWGFGNCAAPSPIAGTYVLEGNPNAMLTITSDKITSTSGPVSFTVHYNIKSAEGKKVTIELDREPKETLLLEIEKDLIKIRAKHQFAGNWKRKAASP